MGTTCYQPGCKTKHKSATITTGNHLLQRSCSDCPKKRKLMQRRAVSHSESVAVPPIVHDVLRSPGQPLDAVTRSFMESRFSHDFTQVRSHAAPQAASLIIGPANDSYEQEAERVADSVMLSSPLEAAATPRYDFGKVRVHSDSRAAESARDVSAQAYTVGLDIVFGAGQYNPETSMGRKLLAHELAHTVHQSNGMRRLLRKSFSCSDYAGDSKLEACLSDQDRLRPGDIGPSVGRVQRGLMKDKVSVGLAGDDEIFGRDTGQGVITFKKKYSLGSYDYPDVGPRTMKKLDELCSKEVVPPWTTPPKLIPESCQLSILYNNMRTVNAPPGTCGGAIQYDVVRVISKGNSCPKTLKGLYVTERVRTDHYCGTPLDKDVIIGKPLGPIDSNGYLPALSTDAYGLYIPPELAPYCENPCTETYRQRLYVGGRMADENHIAFEICRTEAGCVTVIRRNGEFIGIV